MNHWSAEQWALVLGGITAIIGSLATAAVKIIAAVQGVTSKVEALEVKVDGRLTQLLERTASASKAEGVTVGRGEMAMIPIPPVAAAVDPSQVQDDGTLVIGLPVPTPPVLLVPVEGSLPAQEEKQ